MKVKEKASEVAQQVKALATKPNNLGPTWS